MKGDLRVSAALGKQQMRSMAACGASIGKVPLLVRSAFVKNVSLIQIAQFLFFIKPLFEKLKKG